VKRRPIRPVGMGQELAHVEKRLSDIGRSIGVHDDDGAARVRRSCEVERLQRVRRARSSIGRAAGFDRRAFGHSAAVSTPTS
jgi:hypothetical protein